MRTLFCKIVICCSVLGQDYLHHLSEEIQKPLLEMQKIVVDIDEHELSKGTINIDIAIQSDAKKFLSKILEMDSGGFQTGLNGLANVKSGRKCFLRTLMTAFV